MRTLRGMLAGSVTVALLGGLGGAVLGQDEEADLMAFMEALTGEVPEWSKRAPALPPSPEEGQ